MKKTKQKVGANSVEELKKQREQQSLREQLIIGPDLLIKRKGSDKSLDLRIEKVELISGEILDLKKLWHYIDQKINTYEKKFGQEFYREIFRLNGWPIPTNGIISQKPTIVAQFTKDFIYGRYPKEILPAIERNNKFTEIGIRLYKHFQFLTPEGVILLEKFIADSIVIMKRCKYWDEFVAEHAKEYGLPFQSSLF